MTAARKRRSPGRPAGGSEAIIEKVFGSTLEQLGEVGFARLSVEEIAAEVGVNKTSIYRRWPTKGDLVLAAIDAHRDDAPRFRETGDLRADLVTLLRSKVAKVSTPKGMAIARALMAVEGDEAFASSIRCRRYCLPASVVQAAMNRGEINPDADARFVSELLLAPLLHRLFVTNEPVKRAFIEQVVDHVLLGLRPTPTRSSGSRRVADAARPASRPTPRRAILAG